MRTAHALRGWLAAWMMFPALPLKAQEPAAPDRAGLQQRLDAKLAELEAVQREVEQLQRELNIQSQLLVRVQMLEVSRTRLRQLGVDWAQVDGPLGQNPDNPFKQAAFVQTLIEKNIARLCADPTLVTVLGRQAAFHAGGETPIGKTPDGQLKYEKFGTQVEILGALAGKDEIDLRLRASHSQLDAANPIEIDGEKHPGLRVRAVDTSVKLKSGESFVIQGPLEDRTEMTVYAGGRRASRINQIQSVVVVTAELITAPLDGFATAEAIRQQPPEPARYGHAVHGAQTTSLTPALSRQAIEVHVQLMELSLTKLRNLGHDVDGSQYWIKALGLEQLHAANRIVDGQADVVLVPPSMEHGLTLEKQIGPLLESGAMRIVGRPTAIANSGEDIAMELASDSLSYQLAFRPTLHNDQENTLQLDLKFSLCEPSPGPSAKRLEDRTTAVASMTERKLHVSNACVVFPGPTFSRNRVERIGDRQQEWIEEFVPVYVVLAWPKLVAAAPMPTNGAAAQPTIRR